MVPKFVIVTVNFCRLISTCVLPPFLESFCCIRWLLWKARTI